MSYIWCKEINTRVRSFCILVRQVLSAETGLGFLFILVHLEQFLGRIEPSKSKYLF